MMQGALQAPGRSTTNEPSVQEWSQADTHACAAGGVGRMEGGYNGGGYTVPGTGGTGGTGEGDYLL